MLSSRNQRRELLDEAFAGDIIGIPNHGVLQLGDTLTEGEVLQFEVVAHRLEQEYAARRASCPAATRWRAG